MGLCRHKAALRIRRSCPEVNGLAPWFMPVLIRVSPSTGETVHICRLARRTKAPDLIGTPHIAEALQYRKRERDQGDSSRLLETTSMPLIPRQVWSVRNQGIGVKVWLRAKTLRLEASSVWLSGRRMNQRDCMRPGPSADVCNLANV